MRKYLFLFACLAMFASCSKDDSESQSSDTIRDPELTETVRQLQMINDSLRMAHPLTRSTPNKTIAASDVRGACKGISAGATLAEALGLASGGVGAAVTIITCGVAGAAAESYLASQKNEGYSISSTDIENIYQISNEFCQSHPMIPDDGTMAPFDVSYKKLNLPEKFKYLRYIGANHNAIVMKMQNQTSAQANAPKKAGPTTPVVIDQQRYVKKVFNNGSFKTTYSSIANDATTYWTESGYDYLTDIKDHPSGSRYVDSTYKLFLNALTATDLSTDEVASLINSYIATIEANPRFTDSNKENIYAGFIVALYSHNYWKGYASITE